MKNPKIKKQYLGLVTIPILKDGFEYRVDLNAQTTEEDIKLVSENEVGVTFLEEGAIKEKPAPVN
jgi:hypothetical protein